MKQGRVWIIAFLIPMSAFAQEIGLSVGKLWTNNEELQNPLSFSVYGAYAFAPKFKLRLEYAYAQNEREFFGLVLGGFEQGPKPGEEEVVQSRAQMHTVEGSLFFQVVRLKHFRFDLGAAFSMNWLRGSREGRESGTKVDLFDSNKFGLGVALLVETVDVVPFPVSFHLLLKRKSLRSSETPLDAESPLSSAVDISQVQVGAAYRF